MQVPEFNRPAGLNPLARKIVLFSLTLIFILPGISCKCRDLNPFEKPSVSFQELKVNSLDFYGMDLVFTIKIDNPNFIGLKVKQFYYSLSVEERRVATGQSMTVTDIKGKDTTLIDIPATVPFDALADSLALVFKQDSLNYTLEGYIVLDSPIGELKFNFEDYDFHKGKLKIPDLPGVRVKSVEVKEWGILNIQLELVFELENTNDFSFELKELRYLFKLNDVVVSKARVENTTRFESGGSALFRIPINLKVISLRSGLLKALKQRRLNYKLMINAIVDSNKGEIKLPVREEGSIDLLR